MVETGTRKVGRALGVEDLGIGLPDGAARLAVERHEAARSQRGDALVPRRLADAVVHHLHTLAAGEALDLGFEILACVVDRLVRTSVSRALCLLGGPGGTDHARTTHLRDRAE